MRILKTVLACLAAILLLLAGWFFFPLLQDPPGEAWYAYMESLPALKPLAKERSYTLRVTYVEDPRLPTLSKKNRLRLYGKVEVLAKKWYGYTLHLQEVEAVAIAELFRREQKFFNSALIKDAIESFQLDIDDPVHLKFLSEVIDNAIKDRRINEIVSYIPEIETADGIIHMSYLRDIFLEKLRRLRMTAVLDGKPFYDPRHAQYTSFGHWAALAAFAKSTDYYLTNTVAAGADSTMPIYVVARGGVTTGFIKNNGENPTQAGGYLGLFPYLQDSPFFYDYRGKFRDEEERIDAIATMWLHELGHLYPRYAEHYGHPHCVHVAAKGLDYIAWHRRIRKGGYCDLEHKTVTKF